MRLQTFVVVSIVLNIILLSTLLIGMNRLLVAPAWEQALAACIYCLTAASTAYRLVGRRLVAPLQELVVLSQQVASHPDVPRLRSQIREVALLEDSLRRLAADLAGATRASGSAAISSEAAHELRSSLGAVKNALYYVKEVCRENGLPDKDTALPEIFSHAEAEIEKAAALVAAKAKRKDEIAKGGHGAAV